MSKTSKKNEKSNDLFVKKGKTEIPAAESHDELRAHLLSLYLRCVSNQLPLDSTISYFFRNQKKLAFKARGFLASAVYGMLRNRLRLLAILRSCPAVDFTKPYWAGETWSGELLKPADEALGSLILFLFDFHHAENSQIQDVVNKACDLAVEFQFDELELDFNQKLIPDLNEQIGALLEDDSALKPWQKILIESNLPSDIYNRWKERWGENAVNTLTEENKKAAPLDLRVNTAKVKREDAQKRLEEDSFETTPTKLSPDGLRVVHKGNLFRTKAFEEGMFEVQDLGSQLIGFACNPKPTWRVLDACAGGGGKTLHLASLMHNRGEVFAHDISEERLAGLRKRLKRSGLSNIRFLDEEKLKESAPFDLVLIDAPCLGLGTLRRNPDFMWRGSLDMRLKEIVEQQAECLNDYAKLVKHGGFLVYATCSFEPEETTEMLKENKIIQNEFAPSPLTPDFGYYDIKIEYLENDSNELILAPHLSDTDGFYIAKFKKK